MKNLFKQIRRWFFWSYKISDVEVTTQQGDNVVEIRRDGIQISRAESRGIAHQIKNPDVDMSDIYIDPR